MYGKAVVRLFTSLTCTHTHTRVHTHTHTQNADLQTSTGSTDLPAANDAGRKAGSERIREIWRYILNDRQVGIGLNQAENRPFFATLSE